MNLNRTLYTIGKQIFIKYYIFFKNLNYTSVDSIDIIKENYTIKSKRSRFNHARMIFQKNLNIEALNIIIKSRLPIETIKKAQKLLKQEMNII